MGERARERERGEGDNARLVRWLTIPLGTGWRMLAWHVGIWRSYFNTQRKNIESGPLQQPPDTAYVSHTECVRAGQPVRLRPVVIDYNRCELCAMLLCRINVEDAPLCGIRVRSEIIKICFPPIFLGIDRMTDTLDRTRNLAANNKMFPASPEELEEFSELVEDKVNGGTATSTRRHKRSHLQTRAAALFRSSRACPSSKMMAPSMCSRSQFLPATALSLLCTYNPVRREARDNRYLGVTFHRCANV